MPLRVSEFTDDLPDDFQINLTPNQDRPAGVRQKITEQPRPGSRCGWRGAIPKMPIDFREKALLTDSSTTSQVYPIASTQCMFSDQGRDGKSERSLLLWPTKTHFMGQAQQIKRKKLQNLSPSAYSKSTKNINYGKIRLSKTGVDFSKRQARSKKSNSSLVAPC
jgi:hypothetical protein